MPARRSPSTAVTVAIAGTLSLCAAADELVVADAADWQRWSMPGDAMVIAEGAIGPAFVRSELNAVDNAAAFGGGVRDAGASSTGASALIDGDPSSAWRPSESTRLENWWIEIDLGRAVSAHYIELDFDTAGPALEFFRILSSDGEPFFSSAGVVIDGTLRYNRRERFSFNDDYTVRVDFGLAPVRYIRVQADRLTPGAGLADLRVATPGDNLSLGALERGGSIEIRSLLGSGDRERSESEFISSLIIDGDITTYWARKEGRGAIPIARFTLDLGALFWIDRTRLLGDFSGLPTTGERARTRFGAINYLWYQMSGSDGSLAPDGTLRWTPLGDLPESQRNQRDIVHFEEGFDLQKIRYLRLLFGMTSAALSGVTAEMQVFGQGYAAEVVLRSPLFDLGSAQNVTAVDWEARNPAGTSIDIRSRTGNQLQEELSYFDKNGKELTQRKWERLIPGFRGPVDTTRTAGSDWSEWSRSYQQSGQAFQSPGPRRYVQMEARFLSDDPMSAAQLDDLTLTFHPPLVAKTTAEVSPAVATPGSPVLFTYVLRVEPDLGDRGFDEIEITASADMRFQAVRLDGAPVTASATEVEAGFRLRLDERVRRQALLEIDFESTVFVNQTRYEAVLFNSDLEEEVRQRVDEGDAAAEVDNETVSVSLPPARLMLRDLQLSSRVITPNADGVNDELRIRFNLLRVLAPRQLTVGLYDLSGARVADLLDRLETVGSVELSWDGTTKTGRAAPGLYILLIEIDGDSRRDRLQRTVAVAY